MKRTLLTLLAATSLTFGASAAAEAQSINQRQAELDNRIDAGVRSRSLTAAEAAQLRAEFADIARLEARYRASGGLSSAEQADLSRRFDLLSSRIRYERNDGQGAASNGGDLNINARQRDLDARIDAGVRGGGLTVQEAAQLRTEFQAIARQEAQYRASGRGLTPAERSRLEQQLDNLDRRIQRDRTDNDRRGPDRGDLNINARQRELDARIDAGVRAGSLTVQEAAQLRAEFQAIARQEAQYRASGRGLTPPERMRLQQQLDMLDRRVQRDRADSDRRWTDLDQRQAAFDSRLNQAVRDRRVSAREAANLRAEFQTIARLERQYRRSRPGITPAERVDLNRRFDRMEANFRASMTPSDNLFDLLFGLIDR